MSNLTRINNREYGYVDIRVLLFGQEVATLRAIEYKIKKAKEPFHGSGRTTRGIQHGKREVEGSFTILHSEFIALNRSVKSVGYKDLLDIDMDFIIAYTSDNAIVTVDRIIGASISELPTTGKEGDSLIEHSLPFVAIDIDYGI